MSLPMSARRKDRVCKPRTLGALSGTVVEGVPGLGRRCHLPARILATEAKPACSDLGTVGYSRFPVSVTGRAGAGRLSASRASWRIELRGSRTRTDSRSLSSRCRVTHGREPLSS
jgi:hypothetical protein